MKFLNLVLVVIVIISCSSPKSIDENILIQNKIDELLKLSSYKHVDSVGVEKIDINCIDSDVFLVYMMENHPMLFIPDSKQMKTYALPFFKGYNRELYSYFYNSRFNLSMQSYEITNYDLTILEAFLNSQFFDDLVTADCIHNILTANDFVRIANERVIDDENFEIASNKILNREMKPDEDSIIFIVTKQKLQNEFNTLRERFKKSPEMLIYIDNNTIRVIDINYGLEQTEMKKYFNDNYNGMYYYKLREFVYSFEFCFPTTSEEGL